MTCPKVVASVFSRSKALKYTMAVVKGRTNTYYVTRLYNFSAYFYKIFSIAY